MAILKCADCGTPYADELSRCPNCQSTQVAPEPTKPMLPILHVACDNPVCPGSGVVRQVRLQPAGLGVLAAPSLLCAQCGHHVVTVRPWLPEEDQMAKITRLGGASDARAQDPADAPPTGRRDEPPDAEPASAEPGADTAPQAAAEPAEPAPVSELAKEPAVAAEPEPAATAPAKPAAAKPRARRGKTVKAQAQAAAGAGQAGGGQ